MTGRKRQTEQMRFGNERHSVLETIDHDSVEVTVDTQEDHLGINLLNTLTLIDKCLCTGKAREIWVFGAVDDYLIRGYIDELSINDYLGTKQVLISDTKTRSSDSEPGYAQKQTSYIQLSLYSWMLQELIDGKTSFEKLFAHYKCNPEFLFTIEELKPYKSLRQLSAMVASSCQRLPPLSKEVELVYEFKGKNHSRLTFEYSEEDMMHILNICLDWWNGKRETQGVLISEQWKCRSCLFSKECELCPFALLHKTDCEQTLKQSC